MLQEMAICLRRQAFDITNRTYRLSDTITLNVADAFEVSPAST